MGRAASATPVGTGLAVSVGLFAFLALLLPVAGPVFGQTSASGGFANRPVCFSTVMTRAPETLARVSGSTEPGRQSVASGDTIYLDGEAGANLSAGKTYTIYRTEGDIRHPTTGAALGSAVKVIGTIEILDAAGPRILARVKESCDAVELGDRVRSIVAATAVAAAPERESVEEILRAAVADATVVYGSSETTRDTGSDHGSADMIVRQSYAPSDVVTVDQGSASGWKIGAQVLFYSMAGSAPGEVYGAQQEALEVGRGSVIWLQDDTAAILITASVDAIRIGHRARRLR